MGRHFGDKGGKGSHIRLIGNFPGCMSQPHRNGQQTWKRTNQRWVTWQQWHLWVHPDRSISEKQKVEADKNDPSLKCLVTLLHETVLLASAFSMEGLQTHANRIRRMTKLCLRWSCRCNWRDATLGGDGGGQLRQKKHVATSSILTFFSFGLLLLIFKISLWHDN